MEKPHVVILGAGCSRAALPNGDTNGRRLPLMQDFLEIVTPLQDLFKKMGIKADGRNLEEVYSDLISVGDPATRTQAEAIIFEYFDSMVLPEHPTIYDHLVLGLREKDVVATFNWDPFLIQAVSRNSILDGREPQLLFLHGNVGAAFCNEHSFHGPRGTLCGDCGNPLKQLSRLKKQFLGCVLKSEVVDSSHDVHFPKLAVVNLTGVFRFET